MTTRYSVWLVPAVAALVATAADAPGQQPTAAPRYFPGVNGPAAVSDTAASGSSFNPTYRAPPMAAPPAGGTPRLTRPVIAGPTGVTPANAAVPAPMPAPMPARPIGPAAAAATPGVPPPSITVEPDRSPADTPASAPSAAPPPAPFTPLPGFPGPTPPAGPPSIAGPGLPTGTPLPTRPRPYQAPEPGPAADATPLPSRRTPNVSIELVAPESISVGRPFDYELVVRNGGPTAVDNVRAEEVLPARAELVATDPPAERAGDHLVWSLGAIAAGGESRIKITVKPADEGALRSRATVSFSTAVESRMMVTRPRIGVGLTGPATARVGEPVAFRLTVSNTGSGPAAKVTLQARFSAGLSHPAGELIEAELHDLPAGESKTLTLEAVAAGAGAEVCVVTCTADGNPAEQARAEVALVEPLLTVAPTGPDKCMVNARPKFTIELANPGTAATDPVTLWAVVPEGFEFVEAGDGGQFQAESRAVGWRLPALPAAGSRTISLTLKAVAPASGTLSVIARAGAEPPAADGAVVTAGHRPPAGKPLEVRVDSPLSAEGVPALRFQVLDMEDPVEVGKDAVYEIRVMNQGTGPCTGVNLAIELADATTATGAEGPTTGRVSGGQIAFDAIERLSVKEEVVFKVRVRGDRAGDSRFRARVSCDQIRTPVVKEESTGFVGQP